MLFGKGNWSIFGVRPESHMPFAVSLASPVELFNVSQLKANILTNFQKQSTVGINPFAQPRKDEGLTDVQLQYDIAQGLTHNGDGAQLVGQDRLQDFFGATPAQYRIGQDDQSLYYGFWVVFNDFEDLTDTASKKEQLAYNAISRPYKLLNSNEKKGIDAQVAATNVSNRKQFPVLVDFVDGRVYAATTNTEELSWVMAILKQLGAVTFSLRWDFDHTEWPSLFLSKVVTETRQSYRDAMKTRADELTRFTKKEVEKLEDQMMEKVVSTFFAISELPTGQWAALKPAAKVKLYKPSDPVSASDASGAFTLLGLSDKSFPISASVVFQDLSSRFKGDKEIQYRKDIFTLNINDNINNMDAGTALLNGFDVPSFKRNVMKEIKQTKSELPIARYWDSWLRELRGAVLMFVDNVTETLQVAKTFGLATYEHEEAVQEQTITDVTFSTTDVTVH